jgi:hypothetical protein
MSFTRLALVGALALTQCGIGSSTSDDRQSAEQAQSLAQAHAQVGMPSLPGFQEKRMVKDLYELRDKQIATHVYIVNEMAGCLVYLGSAVGYGLPYATQYTAPTRTARTTDLAPDGTQIPQAEPNGLFMPSSAEGTWLMLKDPQGDAVKPIYVEPRVIVSPFRLTDLECVKKDAPVLPSPAAVPVRK